MPDHERRRSPLILGEREELRCELPHHIAFECHAVSDPEAVKDREQEQWIVRRLSERLRLLDQCARSVE